METNKQSIDGYIIADRVWYYLLHFNDDDNWKTIERMFGGDVGLHKRTKQQIQELFDIATKQDLHDLYPQPNGK